MCLSGLCCYKVGFSPVKASRGYSLIAVHGLVIVMASLAAGAQPQ